MRINHAVWSLQLQDTLTSFFRDNKFKLGEEFLARDCEGAYKSNGQRLLTLEQLGVIACVGIKEEPIEIIDHDKLYQMGRYNRPSEFVFVYVDTQEPIEDANFADVNRPIQRVKNPKYPKRTVISKLKKYVLCVNTVDNIIEIISERFNDKVIDVLNVSARDNKDKQNYWWATNLRNFID